MLTKIELGLRSKKTSNFSVVHTVSSQRLDWSWDFRKVFSLFQIHPQSKRYLFNDICGFRVSTTGGTLIKYSRGVSSPIKK
jgi:hypothetical protein